MFFKCEVIVHNRLVPGLESKKQFVTIIFSKKKTIKDKSDSKTSKTEDPCKKPSDSTTSKTEAICKKPSDSTTSKTEATCKKPSDSTTSKTEATCKKPSDSTTSKTEATCKKPSDSTTSKTEATCKKPSDSTTSKTDSTCKKPSEEDSSKENKKPNETISFTLYTAKNKDGLYRYTVQGNIVQVHSKFIEEGKCTIGMKDPPHNLIISKATVADLKKFLEILKLAFRGDDISSLVNLDTVKLKYCDLEKPKSTMTVLSRSEYPLRESFPKTLETLVVNNCVLKKFDMRILKLTQLKILDLSNNKLSALCDSLEALQCLRNLHLNGNCFTELPSCLCSAGNATVKRIGLLDLSDNQIRFLPMRLTNLVNLITLKVDRNHVEFLPSNIGQMRNLRCLHLHGNKLKILPWSFSLLQLDELDVTGNPFDSGEEIKFGQVSLSQVPSLFELTGRYIVKNKTKVASVVLPRMIQERINSCKYCPCGEPCISHCVPYVKTLELKRVAHTVTSDQCLMESKGTVKVVGYLCSTNCHKLWLDNPNTLFTSKKRKLGETSTLSKSRKRNNHNL